MGRKDNEESLDLRVSDAERAEVAERLRGAVDDGRLTLLEYDERLGQAYAAKTRGDLLPLTADLPAPPAKPEPVPARGAQLLMHWRNWLAGNLFFVVIWAIGCLASGHLIFFWPAIFLLISGAGLASRQLRGNPKGPERTGPE